MIADLVGYILQFLDLFNPLVLVHQYERAILLRKGKYKRTLGTGFHFKIPFAVDTIHKDSILPDTNNLNWQRCETKDSKSVLISVAARWRISSVKEFNLGAQDADSVLNDSIYGEVAAFVRTSAWDEINEDDWIAQVQAAVQKRAKRFGVTVEELWITDLVRAPVISLIND